MKICDVTQFYSPVGGGVRRYIAEKRNHILRYTQDEHMLLVPGEKTEIIREGRLTTCTVASPPINKTSRYRVLFNLRQASEFIYQEAPDLIESGDPYHFSWRVIDIGEELNIPVYGFYHSHFPEAYLRTVFKYCGSWVRDVAMAYAADYTERLYSRFDATLVPSEFLAEVLNGWGVLNTIPVHLGIDVDIFYPDTPKLVTKQSIGVSEGRQLLLYIGRLAGEKNTKVLADAFRELHRSHPDRFSYLIIGDGQLRSVVESLQQDIPHMKWISYCSDSKLLADYYRAADIFVHPGVHETFGLVALEAQACGCPVVGIRGSYMDYNIMCGLPLWAVENSPQGLAGAILRYANSDYKGIGMSASDVVREKYSWQLVFERLWKFYERGISDRRTAGRRHRRYRR